MLLTDFEKTTTDAWFDGNVQKMTSVTASIATAKFNQLMLIETFKKIDEYYNWQDTCFTGLVDIITKQNKLAYFDSRVFTIPDPIEVENYFMWRQKDAVRNSIAMTAQSLYSHKELHGKSQSEQQDMIHAKGQNWNDMPEGFKRGRTVVYYPDVLSAGPVDVVVPGWKLTAMDFIKEREELTKMIPKHEC